MLTTEQRINAFRLVKEVVQSSFFGDWNTNFTLSEKKNQRKIHTIFDR